MYIPLEKTIRAGSAFTWLNARAWRSVQLIVLIFFMAVLGVRSPYASPKPPATPSRHEDRVIKLIMQMADQAQLSPDIGISVRAQAQAGVLLWPYDREQARAIFRRAFQPLLRSPVDFQPASAVEAARRQLLRIEFLNQIADCDPGMAETLARSFVLPQSSFGNEAKRAGSEGAAPWIAAQGRLESESRELLVSVALRMARADTPRAVALAQLSLAAGISPYFDRLLARIGESDPTLADRLFAGAVDYLERSRRASLGDIHTLSFYLVAAAGTVDKSRLAQTEVVRFLNLACDLFVGACGDGQAEASSFQLACTGSYLKELLLRYLPTRAAQLQERLAELAERQESGPAINVTATPPIDPGAIEQAARNSADERERDALYAKAVFAHLARAELRQAQEAATHIANPEMCDRLLLTVARRLLSTEAIKDAMQIAPLVKDSAAKTNLLVKLADAALAAGAMRCAKTLLDLAGLEAARVEARLARARSQLAIVAVFSSFDPARAFAAMQEAVKSLNEIAVGVGPALNLDPDASRASAAQTEDLFQLDFADSLTALARFDFDRALQLAQQLNGKELSVIAQLAVCEGGLRPESVEQR